MPKSAVAVLARHERLIHWLAWRRGRAGSALLNPQDLAQSLRLTVAEVWRRHGRKPSREVDRIVRTALTRSVSNLFAAERRWTDAQAVAVHLGWLGEAVGRDGAFMALFWAELQDELYGSLSDLSFAVFRELIHPTPGFQLALLDGTRKGGPHRAAARYFGTPDLVLTCAMREIRRSVEKNLGLAHGVFLQAYLSM